MSPSTLTHHFNVLREAGVIRQYYVGTTKMNTLRAEEMEERFPGLLAAVMAACAAEAACVLRPAGCTAPPYVSGYIFR